MKRKHVLGLLLMYLQCLAGHASAESPFGEGKTRSFDERYERKVNDFNGQMKAKDAALNDQIARFDAFWNDKVAEFDALWEGRKKTIERKWDKAYRSSPSVWVHYSKDDGARTIADFENGAVEISVLVPQSQTGDENAAKTAMREEITEVLTTKDDGGNLLLGNLAQDGNKAAGVADPRQFMEAKLAEVRKGPVIEGSDNVPRREYTLKIELAPEYKRARIQEYSPMILKYSADNHLPPELVTAIIDAESSFNPFAISRAYAVGLMQLIPRYGAKDAYRSLYGEEKVVPFNYLYDPDNNIKLGTAYFRLLMDDEWAGVSGLTKRKWLSICSYNWGPQNVKRALGNINVEAMPEDELYAALMSRVPDETKGYLKRIIAKEKRYKPIYG